MRDRRQRFAFGFVLNALFGACENSQRRLFVTAMRERWFDSDAWIDCLDDGFLQYRLRFRNPQCCFTIGALLDRADLIGTKVHQRMAGHTLDLELTHMLGGRTGRECRFEWLQIVPVLFQDDLLFLDRFRWP